jgi:hypothetical protein
LITHAVKASEIMSAIYEHESTGRPGGRGLQTPSGSNLTNEEGRLRLALFSTIVGVLLVLVAAFGFGD